MTKYRDFVDHNKSKYRMVIGGVFQCQECDVVVDKATYDQKENKLFWSCSVGHKSAVSFNL